MASSEHGQGQDGNQILEETFSSIERGNELEKKEEYWKATDAFIKAHGLLRQLSSCKDVDTAESPDPTADNTQKVIQLYKQQATDYFNKSRQTLIKALLQESDTGKMKPSNDDGNDSVDTMNGISEETSHLRLVLFATLFAREEDLLNLKEKDKPGTTSEPVAEQQTSLEERLLALNKSLPSGFKTSDERMRDINQGLNRLGLSLFSSSSNNIHSPLDQPMKSETEQVDDIIAQAKDEVEMSRHHPLSSTVNSTFLGNIDQTSPSADDVFLDDSGDSDLLDDGDIDDDENVGFSKEDIDPIRNLVNEAQSSLAQLNSLLDAGADDEDDDILFDQKTARKSLIDARLALQHATQKWRDALGV